MGLFDLQLNEPLSWAEQQLSKESILHAAFSEQCLL